MHALICFLIFMAGSCFGSFLHVCLRRNDWKHGRSRCDHCGYTLKWFDLIPVFSFLIFRGKCRKCKGKISISHFVSELMMGASFLCSFFCFTYYGFEYAITVFVGLCFLTVAAIQDYIEKQIYVNILYGGIISTAAAHIIQLYLAEQYFDIVLFIEIAIVLKIIFTLLTKYTKDKIGDGDYDLFLIMYCICGGWGAVYAVTIACVTGCAIYIPLILMKKTEKNQIMPFAPLLLIGTIAELSMKMFM